MVLDLRMPKRDGVAVVQRVIEADPEGLHAHHDHL
jgi:CheY-like chemotaxis protein